MFFVLIRSDGSDMRRLEDETPLVNIFWQRKRFVRVLQIYKTRTERSVLLSTKHLYTIYIMLDQRRRRWADVLQMLYKCSVFAGVGQS